MNLYLVQHADALTEEEDPSRSLSEKGIHDISKIGAFVKDLNIGVHHILHSGKMRSLQTARILAENITSEEGTMETDGLSPKDDPALWGERLSKASHDMMLVGHLPHLSKLASLILRGNPDKDTVAFEKGSLICLKKSGGNEWTVDWMIKPRMFK